MSSELARAGARNALAFLCSGQHNARAAHSQRLRRTDTEIYEQGGTDITRSKPVANAQRALGSASSPLRGAGQPLRESLAKGAAQRSAYHVEQAGASPHQRLQQP
jgi:hypothetical protein